MEQMSLFDMEETGVEFDVTKRLQVVKSQFVEAQSVSWQDLFEGFDEIYAITFSSGIQFMMQLLNRFEYAEVIFGCEGLVDDTVAAIMAVERTLIEKITKNKLALQMCEKMEAEELRLYVSRDIKSHEKVFCLRSKDGRTRVVTGSANMSASAFCGIQRENITYYDDVSAFKWYKNRFDSFKETCSDNVNQTVMLRTLENDSYLEEHPEEIPIIKTIEKKQMIIIEKDEEESDEAELIVSVKGLEAELKPMLPKPKKSEAKLILTSEHMQKFKRTHMEHMAEKKEKQKKLPKLHIDYDTEKLTFNDKECNLFPEPDNVKKDIRFLLSYLSSLTTFYGDVEQAQKDYYAFMNWYFASIFMPYLRYVAFKNSYEVTLFPVVGVIYGESNGGKSTFLKMLSKLMCNAKIPLNATSDFTATNIEALKRGCEGVPLNIDDLDRTQFQNHAGKIIKDDEWGISERFINYPAIAITTNKLPSLEAPISKRAIGCRINAKIDKEAGIKNSKKINESMRNITNSFYCEYVRRMLPKVTDMVEHMKLGNEQYVGTMVYNRFKSENVGDKHAKALPEDEWKRVENCHVAIISKEDFEKVAAKRCGNTCAGAERKHETHCLTGKMICGNCGHRLSHSYAGRPKYYCAKHYLDKADGKCNISVLDSTMEEVVMKSLQLFIDMWVDSRKIVDMQREKQAQRLALAEKHLLDMEKSYERINKDLRDAYESYKLDMTDRETYLEQRKTYEQLLVRMQDNIEKQKAAVSKMAQVDLPEVAGFEMLEGQMKLQKLNKEIVDAFVAEIIVYAKDRVEIKWKFRDEFRDAEKSENCSK